MWVYDLETLRFLAVNDAAVIGYGYSEQEFLATTIKSIRPAEDVPALERDLLQSAGKGKDLGTWRHRKKDGTIIDVEVTSDRIVFDGRAARLVMSLDVTERKRAEAAQRASDAEFRSLAAVMPQIVWATRPDGSNIYFNQQWIDYTGLTLEESLGHGWIKPFHPEDRQRAWDAWQHATATIGKYGLECRLRRADGVYRWWLIRGEAQRDADGKVLKWFGTCTDIDDLKSAEIQIRRTNRSLKMLSACNEALIHAEAEDSLLKRICQIAVEEGGYRMAWVGYAEHDEMRSIRPVAWAGVEDGYLSEINLSWRTDHPSGQGPAGRTIRGNQIVRCEDVEADPGFFWVEAAKKRGYRGLICLPLKVNEQTTGLLALYSSEIIQPPPEELQLLRELAEDLAFGIQTLRSGAEKQKLQEAVLAIARGVSASMGRAFFTSLNRHIIQALDADAALIATLESPQGAVARTVSVMMQSGGIDNFDYTLAGTPSEQVARGRACLIPQNLQAQFPNDPMLAARDLQAYAGTPLFDAQGAVIGLIGVFFQKPAVGEQFTLSTLQIFAARASSELERQKADRQMREQAALLDAAHEAIIVRDLDGKISYWNKGAERLYGWSADEVIGRDSTSFIYLDTAQYERARAEVIKKGNWEGELQKLRKDGKEIDVQVSWTLVCDPDGRPKSILGINSDITEKKKLEAQFLRSQRMESIGTLAGGIAHDLNNVLAPILMSIEILKSVATTREDQKLLETLMNSAQRGADLVKQVLSFARGIQGARIRVNVSHLMGDLAKVMQETFPKDISINYIRPASIWSVKGDPTQIHQVILNLAVNARDAMPNGGKLTLGAENTVVDNTFAGLQPGSSPGPYVVIIVKDTGLGIPFEIKERIFEPFFTTKEVGKGTGLGLSTTMAIVKSHGGFISLDSKLGDGTKFEVYLPADPSGAARDEKFDQDACLPRGKGELILVVDDEESIREVAKSTLEAFGYSVIVAANGAEAIALYAQLRGKIALVLTDMAMPVMDGPALIVALKAINPAVRVIGSSGLSTKGGNAKAVSAGLRHFIPKPYTAETMLKALRDLLDES